MGAWESKRWEPKRIGDGAVDNKGGAHVMAIRLKNRVRKETEGRRK